jgi:DNA-binding XRE family transcriptional regulator
MASMNTTRIALDAARLDARVDLVAVDGHLVPTLVISDGMATAEVPAAGPFAARAAARVERVAADLTAGGFGGRLRALRAVRRVKVNTLARRIGCSRGYLWELERGRKQPSVDIAERLDSVLDAGGELVALATGVPPGCGSWGGGIGEVRAGGAWLRLSAPGDASLVRVSVEAPVGEDDTALADAVRGLVLTGRIRVEISLDEERAAELMRLLDKATSAGSCPRGDV